MDNTTHTEVAQPENLRRAIAEVCSIVVGQQHLVDQLFVTLLAKGHCLLEGVPGVAKTLAVRTFATVVGGSFVRLQFTPDLVPSDIVGTRIYKPSTEGFAVEKGPVFVNFVLADEVNRAPAKVQAAMLELMAEGQVSLGGETFELPQPFTVFATQNPVESEGVYPLPEAQRDRFLLKATVPLPNAAEEANILQRMGVSPPTPQAILSTEEVLALQHQATSVYCHPMVSDYIVRLVMATRHPSSYGIPALEGMLQAGASPRATLGLLAASRGLALLRGRDHVLPQDVQELAVAVIAHRLLLTFEALADGVSAEWVVHQVLSATPAPVAMPAGVA